MNAITQFYKALQAEKIKVKRTGIVLLAVLMGALSPIILFVFRCMGSTRFIPKQPHNLFVNYLENALEIFAYYLFPFAVILIASRLAFLDHKTNGWLMLESLPVKRSYYYTAKFTILVLNNAIIVACFLLSSVFSVYLLALLNKVPVVGLLELPVLYVCVLFFRLWLGSIFLAAFQYGLSVRYSNFLWPLCIGLIGFGINAYLNEVNLEVNWFPYTGIANVFNHPEGSAIGLVLTYVEWIALLLGGLGVYWGASLFVAKYRYTKKLLVQTVGVIVMGGLAYTVLDQPRYMEKHKTTVLKGSVVTDVPVTKVWVVEPFVNDTVATIPVLKGTFYHQFKKELPLSRYELHFGHRLRAKLYFGSEDSLNVKVLGNRNHVKLAVTGTRMAENTWNGQRNYMTWLGYRLKDTANLMEPDEFFRLLRSEWSQNSVFLERYKTPDNFRLRNDFKALQTTLFKAEYDDKIQEYQQRYKLKYPNKNLVFPADLKSLKEELPYSKAMLFSRRYREVIKEQLLKRVAGDEDQLTKLIQAVISIKDRAFKEAYLFKIYSQQLNVSKTTDDVEQWLTSAAKTIHNTVFLERLTNQAQVVKRLMKGEPAPDFRAVDRQGNLRSLQEFQGRYVLIDVWASWCGPCKRDAPYFEKYAKRYQSKKLAFLSLSVDRSKTDWLLEVADKPKEITQWRVENKDQFMRRFNIQSIPRYLLIDPEGRIVHLQLPKPTKPAFEWILKKELGI